MTKNAAGGAVAQLHPKVGHIFGTWVTQYVSPPMWEPVVEATTIFQLLYFGKNEAEKLTVRC